ncbi:MAG: GDYXXLXY domain-containing protein [Flavobacteriales bacterium]
MNRKKILFALFILLALVQLSVPAKMILDREDLIKTGIEFKFKTAPIDPSDPFRGKYITLNYDEDKFYVLDEKEWKRGDVVYVSLSTDSLGFAKVKSVSKDVPTNHNAYVKAKVDYSFNNDDNRISIKYPFERFYMEESKAYDAELAYRASAREGKKEAYALINVKDGEAVLRDVLIEGVSIQKIVEHNQLKNNR